MSEKLTAQQYRDLIERAIGTSDSDSEPPNSRTLYTPPGHRAALDPNASIVLGGRGVGKTAWFHALLDKEMREIAADRYQMPALRRVRVHIGFGSKNRPDNYPGQRTLNMLLDKGHEAVDIWYAVALYNFESAPVRALADWESRTGWVLQNPEGFETELARIDETTRAEGVTRLLLFDALDLLHSDRAQADVLASGALRLALELRTKTRNLRAKLFLRPDMWESADTNFTDASKLLTNMVDLRWEAASLYSLLFHLMSSAGTNDARTFQDEASWVPRKDGSEDELKRALGLITSEFMGNNYRKGRTYTWIPNHLADGRGQTSPRSLLAAIHKAAGETKIHHPNSGKALHWDDIRTGVQHASETRVKEVKEDIPWVGYTLEALKKKISVPVDQGEVERYWDQAGLKNTLEFQSTATNGLAIDDERSPTGPSGMEYTDLVQDLRDLGIFTVRADGRLDLPDVYRIAFEIGRKGGVPLARKA
ncbi:hypothetical protein DFO66_102149 [Brevibacterium sanguinis]|uniref:AAA domain-containing protein n=2 Tax=Brevibacterium TaxID=1696 RepID=A0A366ILL9_9MICO|nr:MULTISPECIES: hypothetical protein [Brevibacterium]RBP67096.1 hypothetical protein DFO66_102149 [Brevibacterium sanguinis]RBP73621.1 hypothetical protein DFO65_102149 [Brevibacterium celere]